MSKNMLLRFFVLSHGEYGEPFAQCDKCYHKRKAQWTNKGLVVERIGKTDWECSDADHATDPGNSSVTPSEHKALRKLAPQSNNSGLEDIKKTPEGASLGSSRLNTLDYNTIADTLKDHCMKIVANAHAEMTDEQFDEFINELTPQYANAILNAINQSYIPRSEVAKALKQKVHHWTGLGDQTGECINVEILKKELGLK